MIFQFYVPVYPLNQFIEHFFYYEGVSPAHNKERFFPDGNTEIIIDLSENTQYIYDNESLREIQACRHAWVSGVRTRSITIPPGRGSKMLVVAFKKGKAYPFYPMPMSEIADQVVSADLIFRRNLVNLREQLLASASAEEMFLLLEKFLLRQSDGALASEIRTRCIEYALLHIVNQPSVLSFQHLCDQIGYSQKHLINLFKQQVGVSPKQYLKIMRFQKAVVEIENSEIIHWSNFAQENGYYDQPHFINEFRSFSGFTPGEYIHRKTDTLNYVPVG
ncbi:MAG: AraC family transcriptional regulator [Anaerolineae bacterium]|nr:AraC family transcriptional regulator [Anaerolineae bacterium]MCI0609687.1 AraC family transcriptional regulator [Anaerolineae bacterium]